MSFLSLRCISYFTPNRAAEELSHKPAPQWGFFGVLIRSAIVSLLWYLPAFLAGRSPAAPPQMVILSRLPTFAGMIILFPLVTIAYWLIDGALAHALLRLLRKPSNMPDPQCRWLGQPDHCTGNTCLGLDYA